MAVLTVSPVVDAGTAPAFVAASGADTAPIGTGHNTFLHYKNASASSVTVTVNGQGTTDYGVAEPNNVITVAAAGEALIPLRKDYDNGTGYAAVGVAPVTSVTVAVVQVAF